MNNFVPSQPNHTIQPIQPYEVMYGSTLLDDLHNYFPAILYNHSQFTSVRDLLSYISRQAQTRFNPFTQGELRYRQRNPRPPQRQPSTPIVEETTYYYQIPTTAAAVAAQQQSAAAQSPLLDFMTELLRMPAQGTFADPVPVRPSDQDLAAATTLLSFTESAATPQEDCPICQEDFENGASLRRINHCNHHFHRSCIDTWFLASPRCPVCRHDVRNRGSTAAAQ